MKEKKTEEEIINSVLEGNVEAFRILIEKYQKPIFRLAWSFLGSREEAEDALQEIFVRVFKRLGSFDPSKKFYPWLYGVARNFLRTRYAANAKKSEKQIPMEGDYRSETYRAPEDHAERMDTASRIRHGVEGLPEKLKEVILLFYFEELTVKEISVTLGVSEENVKSRLFRGRKKLRKGFEEMQPEG